ncbi:hypothetical protein NLG97_g10098 [Lecanicillium saksenae]|uniref:Uncharacterized protein n=1 Tax=Lecanicillium saksenae TaxID=468837 RepID=A0ACC1QHD9_9HYPO|nr:hypothetical protein NLG97_g10098 [Lecanicillium saksenae]
MVVNDWKGQSPDGQSRSQASVNAGHRQTVPTAAEDEATELRDLPPPYDPASAPASRGANVQESVNASTDVPEAVAMLGPAQDDILQNASVAADPSVASGQAENAQAGGTQVETSVDVTDAPASQVDTDPANHDAGPTTASTPTHSVSASPQRSRRSASGNSSGYQANEDMYYGMSWEEKDASGYWNQYEGLSGTFSSTRAGCCWSDRDGVFCSDRQGLLCSDHDGCCFSDRNGCCFSDNDGTFCSDNQGCCFSGNAPGKKRKMVPSMGTLCR